VGGEVSESPQALRAGGGSLTFFALGCCSCSGRGFFAGKKKRHRKTPPDRQRKRSVEGRRLRKGKARRGGEEGSCLPGAQRDLGSAAEKEKVASRYKWRGARAFPSSPDPSELQRTKGRKAGSASWGKNLTQQLSFTLYVFGGAGLGGEGSRKKKGIRKKGCARISRVLSTKKKNGGKGRSPVWEKWGILPAFQGVRCSKKGGGKLKAAISRIVNQPPSPGEKAQVREPRAPSKGTVGRLAVNSGRHAVPVEKGESASFWWPIKSGLKAEGQVALLVKGGTVYLCWRGKD